MQAQMLRKDMRGDGVILPCGNVGHCDQHLFVSPFIWGGLLSMASQIYLFTGQWAY